MNFKKAEVIKNGNVMVTNIESGKDSKPEKIKLLLDKTIKIAPMGSLQIKEKPDFIVLKHNNTQIALPKDCLNEIGDILKSLHKV